MELPSIQRENEITLADGGAVEAVGAIEAHVQLLRVALELVTGQAVHLQALRMVQTFLARKDDKPVLALESGRAAFPNLPLANVHRSGFCLILLIADSSATRPWSGPYSP